MVTAEAARDNELVAAVLAGDDQAFAELAARHRTRVFGLVARFTRSPADLEDVCQDVFVAAYFKLRQFRRDSPFQHWLLRIATFKCYDYLRRRRREAPAVSIDAMLESGHEPATLAAPDDGEIERLRAALIRLAPKERLVLTLLELEERSVQDVAAFTGWSPGNVKVRAFRARAALRKMMEIPTP